SLAQPPACLNPSIACFVAGTPVLVPDAGEGDDEMAADTSQGDAPKTAKRNALLAGGMVVVGLSGLFLDERRARRKGRRREDAVDWLFGEDPDGEDGFDEFEPLAEAPGTMRQDEDEAHESFGPASPPALLLELRPRPHGVERPGVMPLGRRTVLMPNPIKSPPFVVPLLGGSSPGFRLKPVLPPPTTSSRVRRRPSDAYFAPTALRRGRWWLGACLLIAAVFAGKALFGTSSFSAAALPKAVATHAHQSASQSIETIRVGERVVAHNPDPDSSVRTANLKVDPATWRFLRLQAEDRWPDGTLDVFEVETLQPAEWVEQHRAKPGATVPLPLDLLEMGVREDLPATVVANEPCPPIPSGSGAVVLTTVNHLNPNVFELALADEQGKRDTIRPTGLHKFFSGDRRCWVNTQELKEGERLRSIDGWLTVSSLRRLPGVQRVYNMTVAGEHVYHVSTLGLLSHNVLPCVEVGKAGEEAAGIVKNTSRIDSLTETADYRVPDEITATTIKEVKNVAYQGFTAQIQDSLYEGLMTGKTFILQVRPGTGTTFSKPLQAVIDAGFITLEHLP
ncbi:MAG: putative toxin, partial [Thermoguttaceae bacterium]